MPLLETIIKWADRTPGISTLILSGSLAGKGNKDALSDYDIAVYGNSFDFITNDDWILDIGEYLVCIQDRFEFLGYEIASRLIIFNEPIKVDFSFHPLQSLQAIISQKKLPDAYNIGYRVLLDKERFASNLPEPAYKGFSIEEPTEKEFQKNISEFWFEIYHVAKYLHRDDLWAVKLRDLAAKKWLRQMLEWHHAVKMKWNFSPKQEGRGMKEWIDEKIWKQLHISFSNFSKKDSWDALENTINLYREIANENAMHLKYLYNQKLDNAISAFIKKLNRLPA